MGVADLLIKIPVRTDHILEFYIGSGSIFFIVGPSGAGKSALISHLSQFVPAERFRRISAHRTLWMQRDASALNPADRVSMRQSVVSWDRQINARYLEIGGSETRISLVLASIARAEAGWVLAWEGTAEQPALAGEAVRTLLEQPATGDLAPIARQRLVNQARERVGTALEGSIAAYARTRAEALAEDHARVRAAAAGSARVTVEPIVPADIIGLYVLVPAVH
jgi:energy-coupling factor transporter ATP-binding protein EcfA2